MDAVEYLKARHRLCCYHTRNNATCEGCPLGSKLGICYPHQIERADPETAVNNVEGWAKNHPLRTRQSLFLERYPNARLSDGGTLLICPIFIEGGDCDKHNGDDSWCLACKRDFWSQEVPE